MSIRGRRVTPASLPFIIKAFSRPEAPTSIVEWSLLSVETERHTRYSR
jgi:hypothetical protein